MFYLLDANTIIDAHRDYYPMDRVPEFWDWLIDRAEAQRLRIPLEIWKEIKPKDATLVKWMRTNESVLVLKEQLEAEEVRLVMEKTYVAQPSDAQAKKIGRDPLLVAYALRDASGRCVVTTEVSKKKRTGANRKLPDACKILGVESIHTFKLIQRLNFRTDLGKSRTSGT